MLRVHGSLQETYWICAFAVNQHAGICGANPAGTVDPVTGLAHPTCQCSEPKFFNEDPPLNDDGKSIQCEMNKFDDMMALLARENPDFAEVVAVDASLDLFGRAWCVAELAEAHRMGMAQSLKIRNKETLLRRQLTLQDLKVEQMKASRPEDVVEILAKIPDKEAFNAKLQELIFDSNVGLVAAWKNADALQQMEEVSHLLNSQTKLPPAPSRLTGRGTMGDGSDRNDNLASPLLRIQPDAEEPMSKQRKWQPLQDWVLRKWQLILYTVLLLFASVGNTVFFKRMTNAMPNYGWYLTQLSTMIYVPFFACMAGTGITQQVDATLVKKFAIMGVFDGLSGTCMVLGGVHTSGTLQVLMGQAVIPVTMLLSVLLLQKQYHLFQYVGATTIVLGIVLDKVLTPTGGAAEPMGGREMMER
eukprot:symbB.v1.2.021741.t1/scaffold1878.1/size97411/2